MDLGNIYPNKAFCDNFHMPKRVQIFSFGENILSSCNEHQKKRRLCKKMRSSPGDIALQIKYSDCVNEWKRLLHQRLTAVEEKIINANNIGAFYRFVNRRIANRSNIGVIIDDAGHTLATSDGKANVF